MGNVISIISFLDSIKSLSKRERDFTQLEDGPRVDDLATRLLSFPQTLDFLKKPEYNSIALLFLPPYYVSSQFRFSMLLFEIAELQKDQNLFALGIFPIFLHHSAVRVVPKSSRYRYYRYYGHHTRY